MIEVNNLSKSYANIPVLKNISLNLKGNRIHFIMGKNGSGKTTFIKCLLGLEHYEGTITYSGKVLEDVRKSIFAIFDDIPLYNDLNGFQNIRLMLSDKKFFNKNYISELGLLTDQKLKEYVKNYSLGERKKLALIAAILNKPRYLIIDEISNGLDIETLESLQEKLNDLSHHSLILATGHHFEFYENIVNELLVLNVGTITHISNYKKGGDKLYEIYKQYITSSK
ncbi:MAG TPA: ABC transporter ATP-binding protein [Epulopiscium sp.]|nr:ABC transporter ATP-binding protein [Candidatus Epulonipiscium sp.]